MPKSYVVQHRFGALQAIVFQFIIKSEAKNDIIPKIIPKKFVFLNHNVYFWHNELSIRRKFADYVLILKYICFYRL